MENINIILIDDHQLVLDGMESMIPNPPFNISATFTGGNRALEWLKTNRQTVDIVISDISMPLMNGTDICKKIKSEYTGISVLMLSMYNSAAAVDAVLEAEADGFILKNAGKAEFISALNKIHYGGTYFSQEIIPFLYRQIVNDRKKEHELAVLTEREKEILELIAREYTSEEIAARLFISKKTVDNHRANMLQKTGSKSTIGLVKFALRNGIIPA